MDFEKEMEKAELVLGDLEKVITSQSVPYLVHVERLAGLKYLHTRLLELKRMESKLLRSHNWIPSPHGPDDEVICSLCNTTIINGDSFDQRCPGKA